MNLREALGWALMATGVVWVGAVTTFCVLMNTEAGEVAAWSLALAAILASPGLALGVVGFRMI